MNRRWVPCGCVKNPCLHGVRDGVRGWWVTDENEPADRGSAVRKVEG